MASRAPRTRRRCYSALRSHDPSESFGRLPGLSVSAGFGRRSGASRDGGHPRRIPPVPAVCFVSGSGRDTACGLSRVMVVSRSMTGALCYRNRTSSRATRKYIVLVRPISAAARCRRAGRRAPRHSYRGPIQALPSLPYPPPAQRSLHRARAARRSAQDARPFAPQCAWGPHEAPPAPEVAFDKSDLHLLNRGWWGWGWVCVVPSAAPPYYRGRLGHPPWRRWPARP